MIIIMLMVVMIINSMVNTDVLSCLQLCLVLQVGCYCQDLCNSQQMGPLPTDFGFLRLQTNIVTCEQVQNEQHYTYFMRVGIHKDTHETLKQQ